MTKHQSKKSNNLDRQINEQMEKGLAETQQQIVEQFSEGTIDRFIHQK